MTKGLHKNSLRKVDNPHQWIIDDARMELIQQIKAEVERLKKAQEVSEDKDYAQYELDVACGYDMACDDFLSFLSDLEKEEKPMEYKDIDTEIGHWLDHLDDKYCMLVNHYSIQDIKDTARHFYELGRQSECVKVKAESALDKFVLENCTHCTIEHCPGMRECYTSSNKQLQ